MSELHEGSDTVPTLGEPEVHGTDLSEVEAHGGFDWIPDPVRKTMHRPSKGIAKRVTNVLIQFEDGTYIHTAPTNARYVVRRNEEGGDRGPGRREKWLEHEVVWTDAHVRPN